MKCYRLKHIPSGLYYIPARKVQIKVSDSPCSTEYIKSNLSKKGKIYNQQPTLKWVGKKYYTHFIDSVSEIHRGSGGKLVPVKHSEWIIEEV